jgi:hypothetical protein
MITLFTERRDRSQRSYSFALSILVHAAVIGLIIFGLASQPRIRAGNNAQRYTVRELNLQAEETPQQEKAGGYKIPYPADYVKGPSVAKPSEDAGGSLPVQLLSLRLKLRFATGHQTLLQPDIASTMALSVNTPIPAVMLWSKEKTPVKEIVAPQPQAPATAEVQPSVDPPNAEKDVSNIAAATSESPSKIALIQPANTSPIAVHGPEVTQKLPETTASSAKPATPAAVIATSDLRMANGTIILPPANVKSASDASGNSLVGLKVTQPDSAARENSANRSSAARDGNAKGKEAGDKDKSAGNEGTTHHSGMPGITNGSPIGAVQKPNTTTEHGNQSAGTGNQYQSGRQTGSDGAQNQSSTEKISLPKNGRFGAVVVGDSLREAYPETAEIWKGRLAYTVFLHVGTTKSWIFQYSLQRSEEAAAAGNIIRLDAPWPYTIVRPNIDTDDIDGDALIIHGFVNEDGHFENLTVVLPPQFTQEKFVLNSLNQWQLRPAKKDDQNVKVEVLLIIPAEGN